jgi:hypothetical protein
LSERNCQAGSPNDHRSRHTGSIACTEAEQKTPDNSPIEMAVNDARRMARRRLEAGGVAVAMPKHFEAKAKPADFIVPQDIDADELAKAIQAKLRERGLPVSDAPDAPALVERKAGGRVVVSGHHLLRLGDGRFDEGRRFVQGIVNRIRARRVRFIKGR